MEERVHYKSAANPLLKRLNSSYSFIHYTEGADSIVLYLPDTIFNLIPHRKIDPSGEEMERMGLYSKGTYAGSMEINTQQSIGDYSYSLFIDWDALRLKEGYERFYLKGFAHGYSLLIPKKEECEQ